MAGSRGGTYMVCSRCGGRTAGPAEIRQGDLGAVYCV